MIQARNIELETARRLLAQGNALGAIEALRRVLADEPEDGDAHAILALALVESGRNHAAAHEAGLALALGSESELAHMAAAHARLGLRDWKKAREHIEHLLALDPARTYHHRLLAIWHAQTGDARAARHALDKAIELDPDDADALAQRSGMFLDDGDLANAEAFARRALESEPESATAMVAMGAVELRHGRVSAARDLAVSVLMANPGYRAALTLMAEIKLRSSLVTGLWWRFNTRLHMSGTRGAAKLLIAGFIAYRLLDLMFADLGWRYGAFAVTALWWAFVIFTWVGVFKFREMVSKELQTVSLNPKY
jgi:tetratricopeptide (TPR) repeat protein